MDGTSQDTNAAKREHTCSSRDCAVSARKLQVQKLRARRFESLLFPNEELRVKKVPVLQDRDIRSPATIAPPKPNRVPRRVEAMCVLSHDPAYCVFDVFHAEPLHTSAQHALGHMIRLILFVAVLMSLVHLPIAQANSPATSTTSSAAVPENLKNKSADKPPSAVHYDRRLDISKLPHPVAEMLDAIQLAIASGSIEDLQTAIDWNEMRPTFSVADSVEDPVAYLKAHSDDGNGRQLLAVLADLLSVGPARQPLGRDPENTDVYVWPYLAERPIEQLTPQEEVDLYRLVPVDEIKKMRKVKRWTWYRVVIGADGTWHAFTRPE